MAKQILPNWWPDAKEAVRVDKRGKEGGGRRSSRLIPVKNATQVNPGEEIAARENRIFNASTRCARSSVRPSLIG